jgi:hypothetical protein
MRGTRALFVTVQTWTAVSVVTKMTMKMKMTTTTMMMMVMLLPPLLSEAVILVVVKMETATQRRSRKKKAMTYLPLLPPMTMDVPVQYYHLPLPVVRTQQTRMGGRIADLILEKATATVTAIDT